MVKAFYGMWDTFQGLSCEQLLLYGCNVTMFLNKLTQLYFICLINRQLLSLLHLPEYTHMYCMNLLVQYSYCS